MKNALLGLVELEQSGEQEGAHLGNRGADWMALCPEDVPESDGAGDGSEVLQLELTDPVQDLWVGGSGLTDPC